MSPGVALGLRLRRDRWLMWSLARTTNQLFGPDTIQAHAQPPPRKRAFTSNERRIREAVVVLTGSLRRTRRDPEMRQVFVQRVEDALDAFR